MHLLAQGLEARSDLLSFIRSLKIKTSREFASKDGRELWQRKYYDQVLRGNESAEAGVVTEPSDYPFIGSFTGKITPVVVSTEVWTPPCRTEKRPPQKAAATTEGA